LGVEAHVLSEQLVVSDSIARKGNQKKFILNTIVKNKAWNPHIQKLSSPETCK
jgi:hypothetical protein